MLKLEIEPIIRLTCHKAICKFNLYDRGWTCCSLKQIELDHEGTCINCIPKTITVSN